MLELTFPKAPRRATRLLCLGAHCDDIEIGCGGTLLKLLGAGSYEVTWVVFSAEAARARELASSARRFLRRAARSRVLTYEFRDSFFPAEYAPLKKAVAALARELEPDVIFTPQREDRHQDHRTLAELTWTAFRRHLVLEYEVPKYEGGSGTPNAYVQLTRAQALAKTRALLASYASQRSKPWFTAETFQALMRLRGIEAGPGTGLAEGFTVSKFCLG